MVSNGLRFASIIIILSHHKCLSYSSGQSTGVEMCFNDKGDIVKQGDQYFPLGSDICTKCTCLNGRPEMCISVLCSPPEKCRQYHAVSDKCCEFVCLDGDFTSQNGIPNFNTTLITRGNGDNRSNGSVSTNNLGLRLIASTITSFLILALLLFMIHRLRQRRLLLMIRRLQTRRLEQVNGLSCDNSSTNGYFSTHNQYDFGGSFNEPPPPYTFWKPPEHYIPPGEAPPPYDESIGVTIVPSYDLTNNSVINRININSNFVDNNVSQTQLTAICPQTLYTHSSSPFITDEMSPIIDTISSDHCYEHITVVRINGNHNNNSTQIHNACSDSTSSSSVVSSPSECSVITSSSTSTQSTVRLQDSDNISRL